jgi:hypothetical protein
MRVCNSLENSCKFPLSRLLDNKSQTDTVPDNDLMRFDFFKCFMTYDEIIKIDTTVILKKKTFIYL